MTLVEESASELDFNEEDAKYKKHTGHDSCRHKAKEQTRGLFIKLMCVEKKSIVLAGMLMVVKLQKFF